MMIARVAKTNAMMVTNSIVQEIWLRFSICRSLSKIGCIRMMIARVAKTNAMMVTNSIVQEIWISLRFCFRISSTLSIPIVSAVGMMINSRIAHSMMVTKGAGFG